MKVQRKLIERLITWAEDEIKKDRIPYAILEAPTGYGKSTSAIKLYEVLKGAYPVSSYIHVLPLRSIVEELYCRLRCIRNLGGVGYQMMGAIEDIRCKDLGFECSDGGKGVIAKSPFYLKEAVVTTFDSYIYNIARAPVAELGKGSMHMEIPRASIFTSFTAFDEAQLYGADAIIGDRERGVFEALLTVIDVLRSFMTPVLVSSATLPPFAVKHLIDYMKEDKIALRFFTLDKSLGNRLAYIEGVEDTDFFNEYVGIRWRTRIIAFNTEKVIETIKSHIDRGEKILVVLNTPRKAIELYRKLKPDLGTDLVLLHGLLCAGDRAKAIKRTSDLNRGHKPYVLIATQIIEAGVNLSFNALITEAAPPTSLAQRAGRVCRNIDGRSAKCDEASVYILESDGSGVYDEEIVRRTLDAIRSIRDKGAQIEWRLYDDVDENGAGGIKRISYKRVSEAVYSGLEISIKSRSDLRQIIVNPYVLQSDVNGWLKEMCGSPIGRDLLVSVHIGKVHERPEPDRLISLNLTRLASVAHRLMIDGSGGILCYDVRENIEKSIGLKPTDLDLRKTGCKQLLRKLANCILMLSEDAYEWGVGLRV